MRGRFRSLPMILAGVLALTLGGCAIGPNDLPSVRPGADADYELTVEFENVMNLPTGADVVLNGIRVGQVQRLEAHENRVDVAIGLGDDVRVPAGTGAVIRQNTVLGDTYIALTPDTGETADTGSIEPGGTIPLARTVAPPQLEDTIAVLAHFVNGGSIQKVQDTMATLNTTVPETESLRRLATVLAVDLEDLARNTRRIDGLLTGLDATASSIAGNAGEWQPMFSGEGLRYWDAVANQVISHISTLLPSVGSIFSGGLWLVPMLESLVDTVWAVRGEEQSIPDAAVRLNHFLRATLLPWIEDPAVNIVAVNTSSGDQLIDDAEMVLRMLGAVR